MILIAGAEALCAQALPLNSGSGSFPVPYTHFSDQEPVSQVLADFARQQGLRSSISGAITGQISGRFEQVRPQDFLDGLKSAFGVNWYIQGKTIHFFDDSEWSSEVYSSQAGQANSLYAQLNGSSVVSPQLPLKAPGSSGLLVFEGPSTYIEVLRQTAEALERTQSQRQVMKVFKLKHAMAGDTTVNSMSRTMTIPGVASILGAMISGQPTGGSGSVSVSQNKATVGKLLGTGLAAQGSAQENLDPAGLGGRNIIADTRLNAIVVYDYEDRMPYYAEVIAELDQEVHLVEIHAAIVDVNTDFKQELGVTYQGTDPSGGGWGIGGELSSSSDQFNVLPVPGNPAGQGGILSTIYTSGDSYFIARIQALEENGEARMLGRPSVLTTDNMEATLENTTTYYVEVAGNEAVDLFKVESGTVLQVTPRIIEKGDAPPLIMLNITIQDDQDNSQGGALTGGMAIPPIKQTKINTQALIEAGQSLLIGGYYFEQKVDSESGLPLLKNIPILGNLFKTSSKNTRMMERLVLITPRVIRLGENPLPPPQVYEPSFSRSPTQSDYEPRTPLAPGGCRRR
ncbi:MAG: type III secretion system outer membrane ring subunit SctC [Deltaproteobacteria bacterium]|nr:type III secretion system outer membrane ring subunit SctC [Deltaproteobacteria bacterium]